MRPVRVSFRVNGRDAKVEVEPRRSLADALRTELDLVGTRLGCEHGVCGACTVLVDGRLARSCLMFAVQAEGTSIETVESLGGDGGGLDPLQSSLRRHHAVQCGFCMSGILMSLTALFREDASPSEATIKDILGGHICRCTGYQPIVAAALAVARAAAGER